MRDAFEQKPGQLRSALKCLFRKDPCGRLKRRWVLRDTPHKMRTLHTIERKLKRLKRLAAMSRALLEMTRLRVEIDPAKI